MATGNPGTGIANDGQVTALAQSLWRQFSSPDSEEGFYTAWLGLVSLQIRRAVRSVLVLGPPDSGHYTPVAFWPDGQGGSEALASLAEQCLASGEGMAGQLDPEGARFGVAYPVVIDNHLHGVVAIEIGGQASELIMQQALQQLHWGTGLIDAHIRADQSHQNQAMHTRLVTAIDLIVSALELPDFEASAKAVVTELSQKLDCDRVSLGFLKRNYIHITALSHSAELEKQMNTIRAIGDAMDEALDQLQPVVYPPRENEFSIVRKHEAVARLDGYGALLTLPIYAHGAPVGALMFERSAERVFDKETIALCLSVSAVVGSILYEKKLNNRNLYQRMTASAGSAMSEALGPRHYLSKAVVLAVIVLIAGLSIFDGQNRVTADTVLEGSVQRNIVAPFDGYIAEAGARSGDIVRSGQILSELEDKDLILERLKWLSQHGQLSKQYDEAMALRDRARVNIIGSQIEQADAQLNLVDELLARTHIAAPFDGLIISGDLSQKLGAAIKQGDLLFVIAPLDNYRVIIKVDEKDIQEIRKGQEGVLVLSSLPDEQLSISVDRVTPVSTSEDGSNYFRVEAAITSGTKYLRPGMEGISKINIDRRSLLWIWTHDIIDWVKLTLWRLLP